MREWGATSDAPAGSEVRVAPFVRPPGEVFCPLAFRGISRNDGFDVDFEYGTGILGADVADGQLLPALTDIQLTGAASANNEDVEAHFTIIMVRDGKFA